MTGAEKIARTWVKRAVTERVSELTDQWLASNDKAERDELHAAARATIELEDYLSARIRTYTGE
jgi:hypothetical protein